jgi:hypothetical protein
LSPRGEDPIRPFVFLNSRECSPLGVDEREEQSPLGTKLTPGGQVHPYVVKTGLSYFHSIVKFEVGPILSEKILFISISFSLQCTYVNTYLELSIFIRVIRISL